MKQQKAILTPKGMQKDTSVTVFSSEFAFDIKNMRFTSTEEGSFMCLTNEKSNSKAKLYIETFLPGMSEEELGIIEDFTDDLGVIIGLQQISDYLIVFRIVSNINIISKIVCKYNKYIITDIYTGNLNFSKEHPIESIGILESETIHKIYWIDGLNVPRVINTSKEGISKFIDSDNQFDFITNIPDTGLKVSIEKSFSGGLFPGGVLQYAITYYNKYGQQSNFVYQSPLQYTSYIDRGISPEDTTSNTFKLDISNYSRDFSHMRIYRIMRTSLESTPSVERLVDVSLPIDGKAVTVYDTGTNSIAVDPTELLYLGGKEFIANALTHKDNTLFLGNIAIKNVYIDKDDKSKIKNSSYGNNEFILEPVINVVEDSEDNLSIQYYHDNTLRRASNEITFFQKGETYRFGVQFLTDKGNWSDIIHLEDLVNDKRVVPSKFIDEIQEKPMFKTTLDISTIKNKYPNFIGARLLCVYPTDLNREVLCQGIAIPTVYNLTDRLDNTPFTQSSWFARPDYMFNNFDDYIRDKNGLKRYNLSGFPLEYRMFHDNNVKLLPAASAYNAEIQYSKVGEEITDGKSSGLLIDKSNKAIQRSQYIKDSKNYNNFGVDRTIVTFHSPELDTNFSTYMQNSQNKDVKFRVIGHVPYKGTYSDIMVETDSAFDPMYSRLLAGTIRNKSIPGITTTGDSFNSFPIWVDAVSISEESTGTEYPAFNFDGEDKSENTALFAAFAVYPWHRAGSMNNQGKRSNVGDRKSVLKEKIISNFRNTLPTRFLDSPVDILGVSDIEYFNSNEMVLTKLKTGWNSNKIVNYYGNVNRALTALNQIDYPIYVGSYTTVTEGSTDFIEDDSFLRGDSTVNNYNSVTDLGFPSSSGLYPEDSESHSTDVLPIQYKSTSHAVFSLSQTGNNYNLLPRFSKRVIDASCKVSLSFKKDILGNGKSYIQNSSGDYVSLEGEMIDVKATNSHQGFFIGNTTKGQNTGNATFNVTVAPDGLDTYENIYIDTIQFFINKNKIVLSDTVGENGPQVYPTMYIDGKMFMRGIEGNPLDGESLDNTYGFNKTYKVEENIYDLNLTFGCPYADNNGMSYWQHLFTKIIVTLKKVKTDANNNIIDITHYPIEFIFKGSNSVVSEYSIDLSKKQMVSIFNSNPPYISYTKESLQENSIYNTIWEETGISDNFIQYTIPIDIELINEDEPDKGPLYNSCYVLGELYREVPNKFGGTSEEALELNNWTPCSDTIYFKDIEGDKLTIKTNQGDTYFQRYDNLKTLPFAEGCVNNIVDIVSFCCETRINIDGRYDRQRGMETHLHVNTTNFNKFNPVYSQKNNFFNQPYLESDSFSTNNFLNQVTWSKEKTLGEEIDTWTNINLANILDLDGDKGALQKLLKFNNNIYAIQNRGVSAINFNPRVQINTSDGVPIEISNGGKVDGKIYISEKYGTTNKWSVVETPSGFYFVDGINQEILACNGKEFSSLTMTNKMYSWLKDKDTSSVWSPVNTKAIRALYDSKNKDIYFTTNYEALAFSELSSTFTSRYSYGNVGWLFNFNDDTYQVYSKKIGESDNSIWKLHGGDDYGYFFDENKQNPTEYSIEYVVNDNFAYDKIFDTVELLTNDTFIADRTGNMYPFSTLQTQNEYQESISYSSSMKKKFRIWRWPIGRNNRGAFPSRDRIRNTWIKLKLAGNIHDKIQLYNTSVIYYV